MNSEFITVRANAVSMIWPEERSTVCPVYTMKINFSCSFSICSLSLVVAVPQLEGLFIHVEKEFERVTKSRVDI